MKCPEIERQLSEYVDGGLAEPVRAQIAGHLHECAPCRRTWHELRQVVQMTAHLGRQQCPVDLRHAVMQEILMSPRPAARPRFAAPVFRWAAVGAFACAAAVWFPMRTGMFGAARKPASLQSHMVSVPPATVPTGRPVQDWHESYRYQQALGATDGLILAATEATGGGTR